MSQTDQATAMDRLDPETRALLELSSKRGVSDQEIADLLRLDAEEVAERRRRAELRLRLELGDIRPAPEHEVAAPKRPSRRVVAAALMLGAAVALVLVIILGNDEEEQPAPERGSAPAQREQRDTSAGPVRTMERLNSTNARGTAQLLRTGDRARLRVRLSDFLIPNGGGYAVWLTGARDDGRRLYATADTTINTDLELPRGYRRYEFVELARAVPELTSPHSGLTLLRVPMAALASR